MLYAYAIRNASRFALRLSSYHIIHTGRPYGIKTHHHTNSYTSTIVSQPHSHITTEKANPFSIIPNPTGGWAF